jgi:hypothetical protein
MFDKLVICPDRRGPGEREWHNVDGAWMWLRVNLPKPPHGRRWSGDAWGYTGAGRRDRKPCRWASPENARIASAERFCFL